MLLEKALGVDADFWLEAQKNYDLDKARIEQKNKSRLEAIEIWNLIKSLIPVSFLKKQKIITGDLCQDIDAIKDVYDVKSIDQLATMSVQTNFARFKKSTKLKSDVVNIIGWVKLVQYSARKINVSPFYNDKKDEIISQLRVVLF